MTLGNQSGWGRRGGRGGCARFWPRPLPCVICRWMVTLNDERSAALLVRVWVEEGTVGFRGRVSSIDTSGGPEGGAEVTFAVVSSPSDVLVAVGRWLDDFTRAATDPIDT